MKWDGDHRSDNVEDRRDEAPLRAGGGAGIFGLLPFFARFGWKGIAVFAVIAGGLYLAPRFTGDTTDPRQRPARTGSSAADNPVFHFASFVLDDTQSTWTQKLRGYRPARMVVFRAATRSACGVGAAEVGPFYCPRDSKVYIDLSFFEELKQRFGAPGDFAQAYVIAHEIGHHVQNLQGTSDKVHAASPGERNGPHGMSVRLELQADCFAGVWAHETQKRGLLDPGDVDEALRAAAAIGDDRIQKQARGTVTPETWTHGSSEQRARWFKRGFASGNPDECDTFAVPQP